MRLPRSLQARLGLSLGVVLALMWIAAATVTALIVRKEMSEVFDSTLQETAQRILPLAVMDIVNRDGNNTTQRLARLRNHEEFFTYIVRDAEGHILLQSHAADPSVFPAYDGRGFSQTATHRLYSDAALQDTIRITVAEPLAHRAKVAREIELGLGLPLLIVIPLAFAAVVLAVRTNLGPLRRFRTSLEARNARDLTPIPTDDLQTEISPVAATLNNLLGRLREGFEAERSFASNAAHELRTPLTMVHAYTDMLRTHPKLSGDETIGEMMSGLRKGVDRLNDIIQDMIIRDGRYPKNYIPIANNSGGDSFLLSLNKKDYGYVYF